MYRYDMYGCNRCPRIRSESWQCFGSTCEPECPIIPSCPRPCPPPPQPCIVPGPIGPTGPTGPSEFRSSYLEALGNAQTVPVDGDIAFPVTEDSLEIVGTGIEINSTGTVFTLREPGLYHIEWSLHLGTTTGPVCVGIWDVAGDVITALSSEVGATNLSSGALITIAAGDPPKMISLRNCGNVLSLTQPAGMINTAASIRILRFADAPN